jgi:tetratricopeptide (TPR) repeat protein
VEGKWDLTWGPKKPLILQECFPGSKLVVLDHAGHSPFADVPEEFFAALKAFITDTPKSDVEVVSRWKVRLANLENSRKQSSNYLLDTMGWGRNSSETLAAKYSEDWLQQVEEPRRLLRLGFALYDAKNYKDALDVFREMADRSGPDGLFAGVALVWQGHMLDLLGEREQAIAAYEKVVAMNVTDLMQHDQYGLAYAPSKYATERLTTPFVRVVNNDPE